MLRSPPPADSTANVPELRTAAPNIGAFSFGCYYCWWLVFIPCHETSWMGVCALLLAAAPAGDGAAPAAPGGDAAPAAAPAGDAAAS